MKLPDNIKLVHSGLINTWATQVEYEGKHIGEYTPLRGPGYRFRTPEGAWGDAATAWSAIVELVELSRRNNPPK